jgi:hypothetical protein
VTEHGLIDGEEGRNEVDFRKGQDLSVRLSGENIESCFVASPLFLEVVFPHHLPSLSH